MPGLCEMRPTTISPVVMPCPRWHPKPLAIVDRDLCAQGDGTAENGTVGQHGPDVGHILHGLHQALRKARAVCAIE